MNVVRNPVAIEELVELLVVDAMGAFDLAVHVWGPRPDVDVADVESFEMPVKVGLEFGAIVSLDDVDAERQPAEDVVDGSCRAGAECDALSSSKPASGRGPRKSSGVILRHSGWDKTASSSGIGSKLSPNICPRR